jgi:hypothetical protein
MAETRKQLKERLQAAGLWQEYVALRVQLAADGMTPAQAREEALRRVESRAPEPQAVPAPIDRAPASLPDMSPAELPDFSRDVPNSDAVEWVARNLANPNVRAADAPGSQAWGLLTWVRRSPANETTFWGSIWPKLSATGAASKRQQEADTAEDVDMGTERALALCEVWLDDYHVQEAKENAELARKPNAAEFAATLQNSLAGVLEREKRLQDRVKELEHNGKAKASV